MVNDRRISPYLHLISFLSTGADTGGIDIPRILEDLSLTLNDTSEVYDDLDLGEIDPKLLEKGCSHGQCEFCTKAKYLKGKSPKTNLFTNPIQTDPNLLSARFQTCLSNHSSIDRSIHPSVH